MIRRLCVFAGSSTGVRAEYQEAAACLGAELARRGVGIVYGGGGTGLMGQLARSALRAGGEVIGCIPRHMLPIESPPDGLTKLHVVETMHERKDLMAELSDGFVAIPGGLGTLDEVFEMLTWTQLGLHSKPIAFLNVAGYFDGLATYLAFVIEEGFARVEDRVMIVVVEDIVELLDSLDSAKLPPPHEGYGQLGHEGPGS